MNILLIEDEIPAAELMKKMLEKADPEIKVVDWLRSVDAAVEWFQDNAQPDLLVTDIQLLDGLCFDLFQQVEVRCPVIFTTAYDQYAIRAFEVHSIDYLLKPVAQEKLDHAILKYKGLENPGKTGSASPSLPIDDLLKALKGGKTEYKSRFMVRIGQRILAIPVDQIAYFYSESKLTFIVTEEGKRYPIDPPLNDIETWMDPKLFFRINRQFLVRFTSIAEMHPYFKGRIKLRLMPDIDAEIVVSSERSPEFKRWLEQ